MKIGFTCSTFDLFHAGHVTMLKEAKANCDYLIVGLQSDPTIDRPQKNKPVQSLYERWVQLEACVYVDKIIPYTTEKELLDILRSQDINIRFVGEEYQDIEFTGRRECALDMEIHYNKRKHSFSSSELRYRVFTAESMARSLKASPPQKPKTSIDSVPIALYNTTNEQFNKEFDNEFEEQAWQKKS